MSIVPPAAKGTTIRIGLTGTHCAAAGPAENRHQKSRRNARQRIVQLAGANAFSKAFDRTR
jgi:hypothetical protein